MKGIAHFAVGVATASCFPIAVKAATQDNPLYFVLGGIAGLLADTIDFKFYRFLYRHDMEVVPDPMAVEPQLIADAIALSVAKAFDQQKPIRIKLNTVRCGADLWRRYTLLFDHAAQEIVVTLGPMVDTGGNPTGKPLPDTGKTAHAPLPCRIVLDYQAATNVDIFDGPLFQMVPTSNDAVIPEFIPWHRQWSHSATLALLTGVGAWLIWGMWAGIVAACAYAMHIAADQLGFMGSNLFWPLTRKRTEGLKLSHSGKAWPNILAIWLACLVIYWNLARAVPTNPPPAANPLWLLFWGGLLPLGLLLSLRRFATPSFERSPRQ